MKRTKMKIKKARELAGTLISECDPENLAIFLDKYLNDSDIGFAYKNGDDFLIAYMYSEDGEKLLEQLSGNDEDGSDEDDAYSDKPWMNDNLEFPKCSVGCEFIEMLGASECENICPEKFKNGEE